METEILPEDAAGVSTPVVETPEPAPEPAAPEPTISADPRQAAIDRITRARSEELRVPEPQPDPAGTAEESAGPTPEEEVAAPVSPTNDPPSPAEPRRLKLTISGAERELTEAEVIAAAQRQLAGEDAFRRAAALRQGDAPKAPTPPAGAQPEIAPAPKALDRDKLLAWSETLAYGDKEQVASTLEEVIRAANLPANSPTQDVEAVVSRAIASARTTDAHNAAWVKVASEYEGVRDDPHLLGVARNFATAEAGKTLAELGIFTVDQLTQAPPSVWMEKLYEAHSKGWPVDFERIYRESARQAWDRYGRPAAQPQPATVSQLADRRDAKAASIQPPRPQTASATVPPPKAKTAADAVAELKKRRGL